MRRHQSGKGFNVIPTVEYSTKRQENPRFIIYFHGTATIHRTPILRWILLSIPPSLVLGRTRHAAAAPATTSHTMSAEDAKPAADAPVAPQINILNATMRSKNPAIDSAIGPEHEAEPSADNLQAPGTGRRKSVASQGSKGSKRSIAESIATVLSASGRVIKKGLHKTAKVLEEGISAP